jgi:hypothetical protein
MHFAPIAVLIAYGSLLVAGYEKRRTAAHRGLPRISRFDGVRVAGLSTTTHTGNRSRAVRLSDLGIFTCRARRERYPANSPQYHSCPPNRHAIPLDPAPSRQIPDNPTFRHRTRTCAIGSASRRTVPEELAKASCLKHEKKRGSPDIPALHRT